MKAVLILFVCTLRAQDAHEALGPKDHAGTAASHPLLKIIDEKPARLRAELTNQHPRVYATSAELDALRTRAHTTHAALWKEALADLREQMKQPPPPAPAQERRLQNNVATAIAGFALAYKIEGDPQFLAAARKYMDAAVSYEIWGYASSKPNVDLAAGHLLYGLGWGYDLLYTDLTPAERIRYRQKLQRQGKLLADYFQPRPGRSFAYSQNHTFIPMAGLAVAGYALYGEIPEAASWVALARGVFDRVLMTYSEDGYYYEGFEYWVFATPWIVHYLDALAHSTGEDLYDIPGLRNAHLYVAHSVLPDARNIFDFGDAFEGANTRSGASPDAARTQPGGHLASNYNLLYRLAQRFHSPDAQGVAEFMKLRGHLSAENFWSLFWYDPAVKPNPLEAQTPYHYFPDHDVVYWRSSWEPNATAIAIKSGPPEGHHAAELAARLPDWHQEAGHAHPDAGSFILFAHGEYLTGDSGYAGVPKTDQHNTLLINGHGQDRGTDGHDAFTGVPLEQLNRIRIARHQLSANAFDVEADFGSAYDPALGVRKILRSFVYKNGELTIADYVDAAKPVMAESLLHTDLEPKRSGKVIEIGKSLRVSIDEPADARISIGPALLTAAGPPGAVNRGKREQRGWLIEVAPALPERVQQFQIKLRIPSEEK